MTASHTELDAAEKDVLAELMGLTAEVLQLLRLLNNPNSRRSIDNVSYHHFLYQQHEAVLCTSRSAPRLRLIETLLRALGRVATTVTHDVNHPSRELIAATEGYLQRAFTVRVPHLLGRLERAGCTSLLLNIDFSWPTMLRHEFTGEPTLSNEHIRQQKVGGC